MLKYMYREVRIFVYGNMFWVCVRECVRGGEGRGVRARMSNWCSVCTCVKD